MAATPTRTTTTPRSHGTCIFPPQPAIVARDESHDKPNTSTSLLPRYVIFLDATAKEARLARCTCPKCEGYLTAGLIGDDTYYDDQQEEWDSDEEPEDDDDDNDEYFPPRPLGTPGRGITEEEQYEESLSLKGKGAGMVGGRRPVEYDKRERRRANRYGGKELRSERKKNAGGLIRREEKALAAKGAAMHVEEVEGDVQVQEVASGIGSSTIRRRRRGAKRRMEQLEQLQRRKESRETRIYRTLHLAPYPTGLRRFVSSSSPPARSQRRLAEQPPAGILSAEELGVEDNDTYRLLMEIASGRDINPEDYDALLQLDNRNERQTLDKDEVSRFEVVRIGEGSTNSDQGEDKGEEDIATSSGGGTAKSSSGEDGGDPAIKERLEGMCLICLTSFSKMEMGAELRRLPCGHLYCRGCIDSWLTEASVRCPDLSCFWSKDKEQGEQEGGGESMTESQEGNANENVGNRSNCERREGEGGTAAEEIEAAESSGGASSLVIAQENEDGDEDKSAAVALFVQVTGAEVAAAVEFLQDTDFDLDQAVADFYDDG